MSMVEEFGSFSLARRLTCPFSFEVMQFIGSKPEAIRLAIRQVVLLALGCCKLAGGLGAIHSGTVWEPEDCGDLPGLVS